MSENFDFDLDSAQTDEVEQITAPTLDNSEGFEAPRAKKPKVAKPKSYKKDPANGRAVCVAQSWLTAVGVKISKSDVADFAVLDNSGHNVHVSIVMRDTAPVAPGVVSVLAPEILHPNRGIALSAFWKITEAAGFGSPEPVNRGAEPEKKLSYHDNFELVAMRHREFRAAPNPPRGELEKYEQVMKNVCWFIYRVNRKFFDRNGHDVDDLLTYARALTVNFLHKYKIAEEQVTDHDNERLLTNHLKQRLVEWVSIARNKDKSVVPAPEVAAIGSLGVHIHEDTGLVVSGEFDASEEYVSRHNVLNLKSDHTRRKSATKLLEKLLAEMPHERLIEELTRVSKSHFACPDTQREAQKRLEEHRSACPQCSKAS